MKKVLLMSLVCLMAVVSCKKAPLPDPTGATFDAEAIAGTELTIKSANFVEGVKILVGETALNAVVSAEGVKITLPYTLGTFDVSAEQNGLPYALGKLTIKVNVTACPTEVLVGDELVVAGAGFAEDAELLLGETALETSFVDGTLSATVPETVAPGTYALSIAQAGTSAVLADELVVTVPEPVYLMTGYTFGMVDGGQMVMPMMSFQISYNEDGTPKLVEELAQGFSIALTKKENGYEASMMGMVFDCILEDGRIKSFNMGGESFNCTYDAEGHMTKYADPIGATANLAWQNGNFKTSSFMFEAEKPNHTKTDYTLLLIPMLDQLLETDNPVIAGNPYLFISAQLLGWCGVPSANFPSMVMGDGAPINYTFDDNACPTASTFLGMFGTQHTYQEAKR